MNPTARRLSREESYKTLEYLAQQDKIVDQRYRHHFLNKEILTSSAVFLTCGSLTSLGLYKQVSTEFHWLGVIAVGILGAGTVVHSAALGKALQAKWDYYRKPEGVKSLTSCSYFDQKFSLERTVVEEMYGEPIEILAHLKEINQIEPKKVYFLDHLRLRDYEENYWQEVDEERDGDGYVTRKEYDHYKGKFVLSRKQEEQEFEYHLCNILPSGYREMSKMKDDFSLLFDSPVYGKGEVDVVYQIPFQVRKVCPQP